jgi:hypothetical protein
MNSSLHSLGHPSTSIPSLNKRVLFSEGTEDNKLSSGSHVLPMFEKLQTSTRTVVIYTNINFNTTALFDKLKITSIDVPLTKKQKNVDKKRISAPYGSIISVQSKIALRGLDTRKKKKIWCKICKPKYIRDEKEIKIYTVKEKLIPQQGTDIKSIYYYCSRCDKMYEPRAMGKISHFLNQLTIVLSIGKQPLLNIMLFKDNMKIAGCKDEDDAAEALLVLWQDYIFPMRLGDAQIPRIWSLKDNETTPEFAFEVVMRNVDFKLGFPIEKVNLNMLMNDAEYSTYVFMSQYESTGQTNVNIKMFCEKPKDFLHDVLIIPMHNYPPYFKKSLGTPRYKPSKKKEKKPYITFIVFSSSEIILSGRYDECMKRAYEFFIKTVFEHRDEIEEKITTLDPGTAPKIT